MLSFLPQVLVASKKSAAVANSFTAAKSVIDPTDLFTFPQNTLIVGTQLNIRIFGGLSNVGASSGTVTFQVMMGTIAAWSSGALVFSTTASVLLPFWLDIMLRLDTNGPSTSAAWMGVGHLVSTNVQPAGSTAGANPTTSQIAQVLPGTAPADGTGFDSTLAEQLDFWTNMSVNGTTNAVQIRNYVVTQLAGGG